MKYIERIANIAIIVAVAVFLTVIVRNQFFPRKLAPPGSATPQVGSTVSLPGIHFPAQKDSLLLGISTTCHYCRDSLPFYKELSSELQGKVNVIAVLPQDQATAEAFVKAGGLTSTQVVSANLANLGINATPTLVIVDSKGKVKSASLGELDPVRQKQMIAALLPNSPSAVPQS